MLQADCLQSNSLTSKQETQQKTQDSL